MSDVAARPDDERPDPDKLLKKLQDEEARATRGRLRLYLGAAPGVGKTYAMLQEGQRRLARGTDVVVGFVETYNRPLTVEAVEGLEVIPRKKVEYRGVVLEEMDVDALIARHPAVALVDELAHTNAPGSKNEKRWQDVTEVLAAGITVISTLNVQHLESVNDVVASVTGIRVRETVPDAIVDEADELEVVDISPEALRSRMRHGNIYPPDQAKQALEGFFSLPNLAALRELVLKRVAHEAEQKLGEYLREGDGRPWEGDEKVMVLLDGTEASEVAVRRAWRLAEALSAPLTALYTDAEARRVSMSHILTVATDLNAQLREVPGADIMREVADAVTAEGITHLVLIAEHRRAWLGLRRESLSDRLLAASPGLGITLVGRAKRGG